MKPVLLPALLLALALSSGAACAQGFNLGEPGAPAPARGTGASNLGGGFIEFLFTGGRMAEPPQSTYRSAYGGQRQLAPQPGYAAMPRAQRYAYALPPSASAEAPVQPAMDPRFMPQQVEYQGPHKPGTIVIDTSERFLYLVEAGGTAMRYGVGVGREGFEWKGVRSIERKAEWPDWRPPAQMLRRRPDLPRYMPGGPENPLGARAMYLAGTLYRIHGSNEPQSIGHAVSSGCIRMRNEDVIDLYDRVKVGTTVVVM